MKNLPPPTSHSLLPIFCLLLTLFLSGCAGLRIKKVTKINPHGEQKYCLECHIKQGSKKLKSRIIRLCRHCHKEVCEAGIHPINIIFKEQFPGNYLLRKKELFALPVMSHAPERCMVSPMDEPSILNYSACLLTTYVTVVIRNSFFLLDK